MAATNATMFGCEDRPLPPPAIMRSPVTCAHNTHQRLLSDCIHSFIHSGERLQLPTRRFRRSCPHGAGLTPGQSCRHSREFGWHPHSLRVYEWTRLRRSWPKPQRPKINAASAFAAFSSAGVAVAAVGAAAAECAAAAASVKHLGDLEICWSSLRKRAPPKIELFSRSPCQTHTWQRFIGQNDIAPTKLQSALPRPVPTSPPTTHRRRHLSTTIALRALGAGKTFRLLRKSSQISLWFR